MRRGWTEVAFDLGDLGAAADAPGALGVLGILALAAVLLAVVVVIFLPLLTFLSELVLVVPAVVLVRGWSVVAETGGPPPERHELRVRGWRRSRATVSSVVERLERGESPPDVS